MHIVFWQNIFSPHQVAAFRALAQLGHKVELVAQEMLTSQRRAMGWSVAPVEGMRLHCSPSARESRLLVERAPADAIHVFSGGLAYPTVRVGLAAALAFGARIGLMAESPNQLGWRGLYRRFRDGCTVPLLLRKRTDFVLAMGDLGVRWFRRAGFSAAQVFEYGYCVERDDSSTTASPARASEVPSLVIVAQLIKRKGVDVALRALAYLKKEPWLLSIVGDGRERPSLGHLTQRLGLDKRVQFLGTLPHANTTELIRRSDLLILPSRFDGWGAVVNEALSEGVRVVCTEACGASSAVVDEGLGAVARAGSVTSLQSHLGRLLRQGALCDRDRARIRAWSACLSGMSLAQYVVEVLEHVYGAGPNATAPWKRALG